jgi:hypothetical protein
MSCLHPADTVEGRSTKGKKATNVGFSLGASTLQGG